jgi:hypothetical protein
VVGEPEEELSMANQNGGGVNVGAAGMMTANGEAASSLDGFAATAEERPFEERPELLLAGAFAAGVLIGGLVSRLGR